MNKKIIYTLQSKTVDDLIIDLGKVSDDSPHDLRIENIEFESDDHPSNPKNYIKITVEEGIFY